MPGLSLGLGLGLTRNKGVGGLPALPAGYVFLVLDDGSYVVTDDGSYIIVEA